EKVSNIESNNSKKQEKFNKSDSKPQTNNKFNSSKDNVSSKFEGKTKAKETMVKKESSNKKDVLDGEFKVKESLVRSKKAENPSNRNGNNDNSMAKSLMNRLRNIGDELVNNRQNTDSKESKESKKAQKEQIDKKSDKPIKEESTDKKAKKEQLNKKANESQIDQSIDKKTKKEKSVDFNEDKKDNEIDENINIFEEKETIISDDDIEYTTEENIEENIGNMPVYRFDDDMEDDEDVTVYGLEEIVKEDIEDISKDIIQEINKEDLESNESEDIENMREYEAPRRKKNEEAFNESPDVIVPISAEIRNNTQNGYYEEDVDYISPIDEEYGEYEEYYEDPEAEEFVEYYEESDELDKEIDDKPQAAEPSQNANASLNDPNNPDSPYYYSAVGIDNALKKNAVQYPRNNDRNKTGLAGTVNSFKNEMLYLKASMDEIENPTERETVYVIDRNADDEFFEDPYDPYQEPAVIDNTQIQEEDNYESLFNSKKHEYLDKIEEYTGSSSDDIYIEDSNDSFLDDISEIGYYEESEPIIPINSSANQDNIAFEANTDTYTEVNETISEETIILKELEDEFIDPDDEFEHIDDIEIDDDLFEDIITDVGQNYQDLEDERVREANVLSAVDNTRLTPSGKISDYIEDYKETENLIIKSPAEIYDDEKKLATAVMDIVAAEGPVHVDTVIRRIREGCGLSRAGTKFKNTILDVIDRNENHLLLIRENDFLFIDYESVKVRKRVKPNIDLI
ncbi:MAG: DUF3320 domain-containing protein, partial [Methanobrevibacter sp.]|nr:DUF3320 domain-containing protein [Methanobrevibacter sp.]